MKLESGLSLGRRKRGSGLLHSRPPTNTAGHERAWRDKITRAAHLKKAQSTRTLACRLRCGSQGRHHDLQRCSRLTHHHTRLLGHESRTTSRATTRCEQAVAFASRVLASSARFDT